MAVVVDDSWQRRGLGILLLRRLARRANEVGIRSVTGGGRERTLTIKVAAKLGTQAVRNAAASAVVTNPLGGTMTISGLTNGDGTANLKSTLRYEGSTGVYQILATVTSHGMSASAITSVRVQ